MKNGGKRTNYDLSPPPLAASSLTSSRAMRALSRLLAAHGARGRAAEAWRATPHPDALVRALRLRSTKALLGVHPSSLVGANAVIAPGVRVGPFCVIGDDAVIGPNCELGAGVHVIGRVTLGADCVVRSHAVLGSDAPGSVALGRGTRVGAHAVVGATCQDMKHDPARDASHLLVGEHADIREHAQVHRGSGPGSRTVIGDRALIMGGAHVAHDCAVGADAIVSNRVLLAGHVRVGAGAVISGAAAIQQHVEIGARAFVAGGARVEASVPAGMRAAGDRAELRGVNAIGLTRAGAARADVVRASRVVAELFRPVQAPGGSGGTVPADPREVRRRARALLAEEEGRGDAAGKKKGSGEAEAPATAILRSTLDLLSGDEATEPSAPMRRCRGICPWTRGTTRGGAAETVGDALDASASETAAPPSGETIVRARTDRWSLPEASKLKRLNMKSLAALLQVRGLPADGMKYQLVARLDAHRDAAVNESSNAVAVAAEATEVAWRARGEGEPPACKCGEPAKARVVRKQGENRGRGFYACAKPRLAGACAFFAWRRDGAKPLPKENARAGPGRRGAPAPGGGDDLEAMARDDEVRGAAELLEDLIILSRVRSRKAKTETMIDAERYLG